MRASEVDEGAQSAPLAVVFGLTVSQDLKTVRLTRNTGKTPTDGGNGIEPTERASFMCPLNLKEMNGSQPFVYLSPCGCVFSLSGLKAVIGAASPGSADSQPDADAKGKEKAQDVDAKQFDMCPQCGAQFDRTADIVTRYVAPRRTCFALLTRVCRVEELAGKKGVSMAQVALAWSLAKDGECP